MADVYLITEGEIKDICTALDKNVDPAFLNLYTLAVQGNYIRTLLGKDFYKQILSQFETNTLSTANQALVNLMKRPIAYWVWSEAVWELSYRTTKTGVVAAKDDNFEVAEASIIDSQMARYKNLAESFWNNDVKDYLDDNPSLFPLYGCGEKSAYQTGYGLYFKHI